MQRKHWFVFDLGNVVVKLAYERVLQRLCALSSAARDAMLEIIEEPGGYRDMEKGLVTFQEFHEFLQERAGFRGNLLQLRNIWSDFFEGPVEGIEELMERVRAEYRVAFLSNSNEVHAEYIPRKFAVLFRKSDRFIFSHEQRCAKPDPELFERMFWLLEAKAPDIIYVDDLPENVATAKDLGITAFRFHDTLQLARELESEGLLQPAAPTE